MQVNQEEINKEKKFKKRSFNSQQAASITSNNTGVKNKEFPPCKHCGKKGHPPFKCWKRPDVKCSKCHKMGHHEKICKNNLQQKNEAKVADLQEEEQPFVAACFTSSNSSECWLIDSECTNHMTSDLELFKDLDRSRLSKVIIGNGDYIMVKGKGIVAIESCTSTKLIYDVMYVPNINQNLLCVGQLVEKIFSVIFKKKKCLIKDANNDEVFRIKMRNKSFSLDPMEEKQAAYPVVGNNAEIWHKRLGHFHHTTILNMQRKELVDGIPHLESELLSCKACQYGKQARLPFQKYAWRATEKLQLIHTDLAGPQRTPPLKGSKYYIIFIDDFTRMCWIYFLKFKSEVADVF